jgi:D-tagatose-1,6-bisphosphate aldolase subunit GatZ/KbaZ
MNYLEEVVSAQKNGESKGITAICSAHPEVLAAAFKHGKKSGGPVLIEATCNQVNQFGGYSGMRPEKFVAFVYRIAEEVGFPQQKVILGGDHLGSTPWQNETAITAMERSKIMVRDYVLAGFTKIHLDTSLRLIDDPFDPLPVGIIAERTAELAEIAEEAAVKRGAGKPLTYVIGTEVPIAGGQQDKEELRVTTVSDLAETIEESQKAFLARGLDAAWERVMAVVVQPGVEFGNDFVHDYDPQGASELSQYIHHQRFVFEAHSTDYQTPESLRCLVEDHFAILKVGPALTFALREAIFALEMIERELLPSAECSKLKQVLEDVMLSRPTDWKKHYRGDAHKQSIARKFSYSDRSRYYWSDQRVMAAFKKLIRNLQNTPIPLTLISQFLPEQYYKIRLNQLLPLPREIIHDKVLRILRNYHFAVKGEY